MKVTAARAQDCARAVLPHVHVRDVRLLDLRAVGGHPPVDGPYVVDWSLQVRAEQREGQIDCFSRYVVAAEAEGSRAWSVEAQFVGEWRTEDGAPSFDREQLESFAYAVGMAALHPYARETVQTAVSRMGYPPYTLDMITSPALGDPDMVIEFSDESG